MWHVKVYSLIKGHLRGRCVLTLSSEYPDPRLKLSQFNSYKDTANAGCGIYDRPTSQPVGCASNVRCPIHVGSIVVTNAFHVLHS